MAPKTIRKALSDMLEDLTKQDYDKFCRFLLDRREEPRVRRNQVEGKNFLDIADVLVSTFTESKALQVSLEVLKQIDCNEEAKKLEEDVKEAGGSSSKAGSRETGRTGERTTAENSCTGKHFVDKHKVELIKRVSNISPILDKLWERSVIQDEAYCRIRALPTSQEKMRELLLSLRASEACKDTFYEFLESEEPYLVSDLKKNN